MEFGPRPTSDVAGCILGHTLRLPSGILKKGTRLSPEHVSRIQEAGYATVTVASLSSDDIDEGDASLRMGTSICGPGLRCEPPFTGRVNLRATVAGVLEIDVDTAHGLLAIDEGLTFATLAPNTTVWPDQLVATAKVIPFGVPQSAVDLWERQAAQTTPCIQVAPFVGRSVTFVQTLLPLTKPSVLERAATAMATRLDARGCTPVDEIRCQHDVSALSTVLRDTLTAGAELIAVLGASQIADRADVIPKAIELVGGTVHRFGLPIDPGNLTLIATVGETPVLGVPGCARSLRPSGFDIVLDRILAGAVPSELEVTSLGVGGLLKEISSRPQPRLTSG